MVVYHDEPKAHTQMTDLTTDQLTLACEAARQIARRAGDLLQAACTRPRHITYKGRVDLVTETDVAVEALVTDGLRQQFPEHGIMGEEGTDHNPGAPLAWAIDPIDGTTNFAHGYPAFSVTLALIAEREPVIGVTYDPLRDEMFSATRGGGAFLNGEAIHVSTTPGLQQALLSTGFPYYRQDPGSDNNIEAMTAFLLRARGVRRSGSAALDCAYVACGRADGHYERGEAIWDGAAGMLLVREAGGTVSDYNGYRGPSILHHDNQLVYSNGLIHHEMVATLREVYRDAPIRADGDHLIYRPQPGNPS